MFKTNTPSSMLENERRTGPFRSFGFWSFDIVADFEIRIFMFFRETTPAPLKGVASSHVP